MACKIKCTTMILTQRFILQINEIAIIIHWYITIMISVCAEQINTSLTSTKELLKPGGLVTFTCFIMKTGIGTQITLLRPDGSYVKSSTPDIAVDDQQDNTRVYTIASVKPSHAGLYSCLAHDGINTYVPSTKELYVQCKLQGHLLKH